MTIGKLYHKIKSLLGFKTIVNKTNKRTLLYFSPDLPDFDTSSGGKRATRLLKMLSEEFDIYVFSKGLRIPRHVEYLRSSGIQVPELEEEPSFQNVDVIFFAWYNSFYAHRNILRKHPNAKIIVDSVDVHWVRENRLLGIHPKYTPSKVQANKLKELSVYQMADVVFAVTENDKQEILKELPDKQVEVISNIHIEESKSFKENYSNRILFIGGFYHFPNIGAAQYLAQSILPQVLKHNPKAELLIAGSNAPKEIIELGELPGVTYLGYVPEKELPELYDSIFVSVTPLFAGSGIKGKICESISFRRPVITNEIGNEGIDLIHERDGLICKNEEMPAYILKALNREYDFQKMTHNAWKKIEPIVGKDLVQKKLWKILS